MTDKDQERAGEKEPHNLRHVGWFHDDEGFAYAWSSSDPGEGWRRVYVMLTAEERAKIHAELPHGE